MTQKLREAANRLRRLDDGEGFLNVYGASKPYVLLQTDFSILAHAYLDETDSLRFIGIKMAAFCVRLNGREGVPRDVAREGMDLVREFKKVAGIT